MTKAPTASLYCKSYKLLVKTPEALIGCETHGNGGSADLDPLSKVTYLGDNESSPTPACDQTPSSQS